MRYARRVGWLLLLAVVGAPGCREAPPPPSVPGFSVVALMDAGAPLTVVRAVEEGLATVERELDAVTDLRAAGSGEERLGTLREAGREGPDLVLCFCPDFDHVVFEEATAFPETFFFTIPGRTSGPNVGSVVFELRGAGYVAGVALAAASGGAPVAVVVPPLAAGLVEGLVEGAILGVEHHGETTTLTLPASQAVRALGEGTVGAVLYGGVDPPAELTAACADSRVPLVVLATAREANVAAAPLGTVVVDLTVMVPYLAQEAWAGTLEGELMSFALGSEVVDFRLRDGVSPEVTAAVGEARREVLSGLAEVESLGM